MERLTPVYDKEILQDEAKKAPMPRLHHAPKTDIEYFDPLKEIQNERYFHKEKAKFEKVDLTNLPLYTPEGLIKSLDVHGNRWMKRGFVYIFTGRTNSGKSHLAKQLIYYILEDSIYWKVQSICAFSGSGKITSDLDFLPQEEIQDVYDNEKLNFEIQTCYDTLVELNRKQSKKEMAHELKIYDDMIGTSESDKKNMDMRYGKHAETWKLLGTRGRRLPFTIFALTQNFQFMNNYVRDGSAFIFCSAVSGSQFDYIWDQIRIKGLFATKKEFMDFCCTHILQFQCVVFYLHANDPRDFIRLVKAEKKCPQFSVNQGNKEDKALIKTRAEEKVDQIRKMLNKARIEN